MAVAGCDVGSLTAKAVIMDQGEILSHAVIKGGVRPDQSAKEVLEAALDKSGLPSSEIEYSVGTGYGKERIDFASETESEIVCHARGAQWNLPGIRMVIDIGGQDAKVIRMDETGRIIRYVYNDKCASGTGRFLEVMAEALEVRLEDMGKIGEQSTEKIRISNQCVIFAETEVISLVNEGREIADIINALHRAMANRVASLAKGIGLEESIVMTGGVAKNQGVFEALSEGLNLPLQSLEKVDPQINGALGAALIAEEKCRL
jgi:(R)-2-hydroxyacyl-CoA dehydratese activating ATPase